MKVENGFAVLLGVTVVTVNPLSPENILWIFSQATAGRFTPFLNLLLLFRHRGKYPDKEKVVRDQKENLKNDHFQTNTAKHLKRVVISYS